MIDVSENILPQGLYLVAMPIGQRDDITLRALMTLKHVNCLACEDTRNTRNFLAFHQIDPPPCVSYHDHNAAQMRPLLIAQLKAGKSIALVSDGGMPLISDPGYKLVQLCYAEDIPVTVLPGPSAPLAALCVSGLPPDRFFFQGFLPPKDAAREKNLQELAFLPVTLIFFEAPHRLLSSLKSMEKVLGNRPGAVVRELTKTFEEVQRAPLQDLIAFYTQNPPRGEIVVVVGGCEDRSTQLGTLWQDDLQEALAHVPLKDAVQRMVDHTGLPRRQIYQVALTLKVSPEKKKKNDATP